MKPTRPINAANVPDFAYRKHTDLHQTFRRVRARMAAERQAERDQADERILKVRNIK